MITDEQTNKVYFSKYLKAYKCWGNIETALKEHGVSYGLLPGTKDIWARDFMPIQTDTDSFVDYVYNPDYLQDDTYHITRDVCNCYDFIGKKRTNFDIIIDGGNVIKCGDKVIMTDKVFAENNNKCKEEVICQIEEALGCKLVIIPWDKEEKYGHADGMVRYVEPGHVVINHYADIDEPLRKNILKALEPHFCKISELRYGDNARSKSWAHLNFLRVGNKLFVPQMRIASDEMAIAQLKEIYQECEIVPIEVGGIVKKGGALNCVSWNINEKQEPQFISINEHYASLMHDYLLKKKKYEGCIEEIFAEATGLELENEMQVPVELPEFFDLTDAFWKVIRSRKQISVKALFPKHSCMGFPWVFPYRFTIRK